MNDILNIKINHNLTQIIGIYLLPLVSNKTSYLTELKSRTWNLCDHLSNNRYSDYETGDYISGIKNTEIYKYKVFNEHYWTIRKINE